MPSATPADPCLYGNASCRIQSRISSISASSTQPKSSLPKLLIGLSFLVVDDTCRQEPAEGAGNRALTGPWAGVSRGA